MSEPSTKTDGERLAHLPGVCEFVRKHGRQGTALLAELLSERGKPITKQAFYSWDRIPAERCLALHQITGVLPHVMRPDVFLDPGKHPTPTPWPTKDECATRRSA